MSSARSEKPCVACGKGPGQAICSGCEQWFCTKHLLQHRQELHHQMDALGAEHDQLRLNVNTEIQSHLPSLLDRINRWESTSIQWIRQVANKARSELKRAHDDVTKTIKGSLDQLTQELHERREMDAYTEIQLNKWMQQLKDLRERWEKRIKLEMMDDQDEEMSSTRIPLIQLRIVQGRQSRGGKMSARFHQIQEYQTDLLLLSTLVHRNLLSLSIC